MSTNSGFLIRHVLQVYTLIPFECLTDRHRRGDCRLRPRLRIDRCSEEEVVGEGEVLGVRQR